MRGNRNVVFAIGCFVLLCMSCSDKYKTIYDSTPLPSVRFNSDTLVARERDTFNIASVNPTINPFLHLYTNQPGFAMNFQYSEPSGKIHFFYRGVELEDSKPIIVAGDSTVLYCRCDTAGFYPVDIFLTDKLDRSVVKRLFVQCLANDQAKGSLSAMLLDSSLTGSWRYRLDATATKKISGKLLGYYFTVNRQSVYATSPVIEWVFHSHGEQQVSVFAIDDLQQHSDTASIKIMIP